MPGVSKTPSNAWGSKTPNNVWGSENPR